MGGGGGDTVQAALEALYAAKGEAADGSGVGHAGSSRTLAGASGLVAGDDEAAAAVAALDLSPAAGEGRLAGPLGGAAGGVGARGDAGGAAANPFAGLGGPGGPLIGGITDAADCLSGAAGGRRAAGGAAAGGRRGFPFGGAGGGPDEPPAATQDASQLDGGPPGPPQRADARAARPGPPAQRPSFVPNFPPLFPYGIRTFGADLGRGFPRSPGPLPGAQYAANPAHASDRERELEAEVARLKEQLAAKASEVERKNRWVPPHDAARPRHHRALGRRAPRHARRVLEPLRRRRAGLPPPRPGLPLAGRPEHDSADTRGDGRHARPRAPPLFAFLEPLCRGVSRAADRPPAAPVHAGGERRPLHGVLLWRRVDLGGRPRRRRGRSAPIPRAQTAGVRGADGLLFRRAPRRLHREHDHADRQRGHAPDRRRRARGPLREPRAHGRRPARLHLRLRLFPLPPGRPALPRPPACLLPDRQPAPGSAHPRLALPPRRHPPPLRPPRAPSPGPARLLPHLPPHAPLRAVPARRLALHRRRDHPRPLPPRAPQQRRHPPPGPRIRAQHGPRLPLRLLAPPLRRHPRHPPALRHRAAVEHHVLPVAPGHAHRPRPGRGGPSDAQDGRPHAGGVRDVRRDGVAAGDAEGGGEGKGEGEGGQAEGGFPVHHQPRGPHPAARPPRLRGAAGRHPRPVAGPAGPAQGHPGLLRIAALDRQRVPRLVQAGCRQGRAGARSVRPEGGGGLPGDDLEDAGDEEGGEGGCRGGGGGAEGGDGGRGEDQAGAQQHALQRAQVHPLRRARRAPRVERRRRGGAGQAGQQPRPALRGQRLLRRRRWRLGLPRPAGAPAVVHGRLFRARHGDRDLRRREGQAVPELRAGGREHLAQVRRHGARAGHQQGAGGAHGRAHGRREFGRAGALGVALLFRGAAGGAARGGQARFVGEPGEQRDGVGRRSGPAAEEAGVRGGAGHLRGGAGGGGVQRAAAADRGGGQPAEPEAHPPAAVQARVQGHGGGGQRQGVLRQGRRGRQAREPVRPRLHGRADADLRRVRSDGAPAQVARPERRGEAAAVHRGDERQRVPGGSGQVPRGRDGRLPGQAAQGPRARRHPEAVLGRAAGAHGRVRGMIMPARSGRKRTYLRFVFWI